MKVILFDLDGTLTDSAPGITACVQYALEKMGRPEEDADKLRCFVGPPLKDQFMSYAGFTQEEAVEAVRYYRERFTQSGMYENSLYPGVEELLAYLKDRGCVLAVASSKPEVYVRQILEHFRITGYFREIVGAGMDEKRTTKAEVIEEALKRLDMASSRQDVVMVGDRSYDILGAHECGIQCVGVAYGYGSMEELIKAGVTYVADSVEELEILAENGGEEPQVEIRSIDVTELSREQEKQQKREARKRKRKKEAEAEDEEEEYPIHESVLRRLWRIVYPMLTHFGISNLISVVATMVIMFIGMIILGIRDQQDLTNLAVQQVLSITGLSGLVTIPVLVLFMKQDEKRRVSGRYDIRKTPEKKITPQIVLGTILMGMGLCQVLNDLITLSGLDKIFPYYSQMESQIYEGQSIVLMLIVVAVIAPVAEELVFRGLVMMRIRDYLGPVAGILLSAVCFGIYHGNMVQFVYAGLLGIFLGYTMEKSQSVLVPIIGHITANFWSVVGISVLTAVFGTSKTARGIVDLVMALVFLSGLSLVGVSGGKKLKAAAMEKAAKKGEKAENTENTVDEAKPAAAYAPAAESAAVESPKTALAAEKTVESDAASAAGKAGESPEAEGQSEAPQVTEPTENK